MRIRYTSDHGGRKAGTVHEVADDQGRKAVEAGHAEEAPAGAAATDEKGNAGMRLRFRRGATLDGKTIAAGAVEFVKVTDEAWEAVNRGDADLDPPPGSKFANGAQPYPPEWVTKDETTEAPVPTDAQVLRAALAGLPAGAQVPSDSAHPDKGGEKTAAARKATPNTVNDDPHTKRKG
jgi:hypothetical protein